MAREQLIECLVLAASRPHHECLSRSIAWHRQYRRCASTTSSPPKIPNSTKVPLHIGLDRNPEHMSAISRIPIPKGEKGEKFTPSVLARPLGLQYPPRVGQNTPVDNRSLDEKRKDFEDRDQILERRTKLMRSFFRPYFQERKYLNYHEGKSFVSNERLFKKDKAYYFPNVWGETLSISGDGPDGGRDTTPTLAGKVSVVAFHGPRWAELQIDTFLSSKTNPELENILKQNEGTAQMVNINIQDGILNQWFVKLYKGRMRKMVSEERWDKYFLVKLAQDTRRGFTEDVRDAMGLLNKNVGYVYLVDPDCRIRWAGSGNAWAGEVESLNAGLKRLIQEASTPTKPQSNTVSTKIPKITLTPKFAIPA